MWSGWSHNTQSLCLSGPPLAANFQFVRGSALASSDSCEFINKFWRTSQSREVYHAKMLCILNLSAFLSFRALTASSPQFELHEWR